VQPSDLVRLGVAAACSIVLAIAAVSDIRRRRIPNWTVLAVIGLFVVLAVTQHDVKAIVSALAAAGIALATTVVLYALKIVGAGDSKLFTAVAFFAGLGYLPLLVVATTLAGGVIALVSLAARPQRAMAMFALRGKGEWGQGIPYGVAIAIGGAVIMWAPIAGLVQPLGARPHVSSQDISKGFAPPAPH
jgi:prepilin peptidase CpaA